MIQFARKIFNAGRKPVWNCGQNTSKAPPEPWKSVELLGESPPGLTYLWCEASRGKSRGLRWLVTMGAALSKSSGRVGKNFDV